MTGLGKAEAHRRHCVSVVRNFLWRVSTRTILSQYHGRTTGDHLGLFGPELLRGRLVRMACCNKDKLR